MSEFIIFVKQVGDPDFEIISLSEIINQNGFPLPVTYEQLEAAVQELFGRNDQILKITNDGVLINNDSALRVCSFISKFIFVKR